MKCKGAIFDMDGLLFDTEQVYQDTWREIAEERGVILEQTFPRAVSGTNGERMCQVIEKYYHVPDGTEIMMECLKRVREKLALHVPIKKGTVEILEAFQKAGLRMAVASSSTQEQIRANLRNAGIEGYFDKLVSGSEVAHGKPAPDIFLYAAEQLGLQPEECFIFEDSENGIRSGHAAGCVTVMVPDLFTPSQEILPCCSYIYPDLLQARDGLLNLS